MSTIILYGSQTGNAEEISSHLSKEFNCKKTIMNNYSKKIEELNNFENIIFICSTTGNGEFPENASSFWKTIKKRDIMKDIIKDVKFTICALGDTNYSNFCESGKKLSKRLKELGGSEIMTIFFVDAVDDEEEQIEIYKKKLLDIIFKE